MSDYHVKTVGEVMTESRTVADLIDRMVELQTMRPDEGRDHEGNASATYKGHLAEETKAEEIVGCALAFYGPAVWLGRVWYGYLPPRRNRINHHPVRDASKLAWPPPAAGVTRNNSSSQRADPPEEKLAGYISEQHH